FAHSPVLTFRLAPWSPPSLESRLGLIGIEQTRSLVMVLPGELRGAPASHDLRPIEDEAGWRAYRELERAGWSEHGGAAADSSNRWEIADGLAAIARLKCPPVRYTMAYVDGHPVGFFNSWVGVDGSGRSKISSCSRNVGIAESRRR